MKDDYFNQGTKQILHHNRETGAITHIADCGDVEKAHFLKTAANAYIEPEPAFDYVAEATLTLSNQFHGELVGREYFDRVLNHAILSLADLDTIKKTLFYGRDNGLTKGELGRENCYSLTMDLLGSAKPKACLTAYDELSSEDSENFIHGVIGLATEAGELLELLRDTLAGKPLDRTNLKEEVGDGKWYMAILAKVGRFMWGDDERVNIQKLRARFPNRFTEYDANNRNLSAERDILEGDADKQLDLPEIAASRFEASGGGMLSGADTN
jgi:NTP pyrophosphatase (non-canonical NTP hydrolase)